MQTKPYNLLIATGYSPQVITETVWSFARQHQPTLQPACVHVVTTAGGAAQVRALLLGEDALDPVRGMPVEGAEPRWDAFCTDLFDRPIPLECHVAESAGGKPLTDIRTPSEDERFADLCYKLVADLTEAKQLPLIGSIAGGRKTMSAHLMTAFSVYARAHDQLTHILVTPSKYEHDRDFFYPTPEVADAVRIDRVDLDFPRLRHLLDADLIGNLPDDRRDLRGILDALAPHLAQERKPHHVALHLSSEGGTLDFFADADGTEPLDAVRLTRSAATTLLVLHEHIQKHGGAVPVRALFADAETEGRRAAARHPVHRQRAAVMKLCNYDSVAPWTEASDVSKAVHDLRKRLEPCPLAARFFHPERVTLADGNSAYAWPETLPSGVELVVTCSHRVPQGTWKLKEVKEPEYA
jgi:CRISPR-associated protein (TIGR02584 family)